VTNELHKNIVRSSGWVSVANYATTAVTAGTQLIYPRLMPVTELGYFTLAFALSEVIGGIPDWSFNRAFINLAGRDEDRDRCRCTS